MTRLVSALLALELLTNADYEVSNASDDSKFEFENDEDFDMNFDV